MKTKLLKPFKILLSKIKWSEIIAFVMLILAFVFFHNEKKEISEILPQISSSKPLWIIVGVFSTGIYNILQALMYRYSFKTANQNIGLSSAIDIFLKRNLISVFLPAGGITSLAYLPKNLKKQNLPINSIHLASSIYGFVGILSVIIVGIPLIIYAVSINKNFTNNIGFLVAIIAIIILLLIIYFSFKHKGFLYQKLIKYFPKFVEQINAIFSEDIHQKSFIKTVFISVIIEFFGVIQITIAMLALGIEINLSAAALAYIISVILMMVSPFLRGLGAVEFSLAYILTQFGYQHGEGLGVTLLYRVFEFWLPLVAGIVSYFWNGRKLLARLIPTFLLFSLGIINILSVITPPILSRLELTENYIENSLIHYSKILTFLAGVLLIFTSAYLFKGYKRAWYIAIALALFSIVGNLVKALDYEEAIFALLVLSLLLYTRTEYRLMTKRLSFFKGLTLFSMAFIAILLINFLSFYFINPQHFGIDFTWKQSLYYSIQSFVFLNNSSLLPLTSFAKDFQILTTILSIIAWILLIISLYKITGIKEENTKNDLGKAKELAQQFGTSSLDYFKLTDDKKLYFSDRYNGFVSYRNDNNFAVVLDIPIGPQENLKELISEFDQFCSKQGLKTAYYRVNQAAMELLTTLKKKHLLIGQEGLCHVMDFSLEGKDKKSLRNAVNNLKKRGYTTEIKTAPQCEELVKELQSISDEWLKEFNKKEIVFAEGKFDSNFIKNQDCIFLKDENNSIKAFLNIIPDFAKDECTYDMIRKTKDAPNGAMDLLILKTIDYTKSKNLKYLNLGMAPLSGIENANNSAEELMKYAYNKVGRFKHYQSLRFFKEKYAQTWNNQYLVYNHDTDLLQLPLTLSTIMKP